MSKRLIWIVLGTLVFLGAAVTVADYRQWRHEETDRYGQGWTDLEKPAEQLSQMYQSKLLGIRLRLPQTWPVKETDKEIMVAGIMKVRVSVSETNLADIADRTVADLAGRGIKLSREREYTTTGKMDETVITYIRELPGGRAQTVQTMLGKFGVRLVTVETTVPEEKWGDYHKTLWEIYKNIEVL